jgi:hypothetical protein
VGWWAAIWIAGVSFLALVLLLTRFVVPAFVYGVRREVLAAKTNALVLGRFSQKVRKREWQRVLLRDLQFEHADDDAAALRSRIGKLRERMFALESAERREPLDELDCIRELAVVIETLCGRHVRLGTHDPCLHAEVLLGHILMQPDGRLVSGEALEHCLRRTPLSGLQAVELLVACGLGLGLAGQEEEAPASNEADAGAGSG